MPNTQSVHRSIKDIRERVRAKETIASLVDIVDGAGTPTTWTILRQDGPNNLGLWYNAIPGHENGPNQLGLCVPLQKYGVRWLPLANACLRCMSCHAIGVSWHVAWRTCRRARRPSSGTVIERRVLERISVSDATTCSAGTPGDGVSPRVIRLCFHQANLK